MAKAKKPPQQKQEATRFSKARLSRTQNTRERITQEKARERMKKKREALEQKAHRLTLSVFLRKFSELLMLSTIIGSAIAYNLDLPKEMFDGFMGFVKEQNGGNIPRTGNSIFLQAIADLRYMFKGGLPVLEAKTTVFLFFAVFTTGAHLSARIYEALTKNRVYAIDPNEDRKGVDQRRLFVLGSALAFLAWSFLSFSDWGWGPEFSFLADTDGYTGSAGSFAAFIAWLQVLFGVVFLIAAEDMIRTRKLVYKILGLVFGLGVFAAFVSLILQLDIGFITQFMVDWGDSEYRNDVGGIIGHNTAISSFLIAPFIIGWTMFMMQKDRSSWKSLSIIACLCLMALILLMAQSRAVIPVLGLCLGWAVYLHVRRAGLKIPMPVAVGAPLIVILLILSQVVSSSINPFYRDNVTLNQRISHLTFEHLQTETRLRIFSATIPVVSQHGLIGTGFHSFPYVYTDAQADYFSKNTEFYFAPTSKRTARAHNEYLQTLLETGVVGLALALMAVGGILLGGWKVLTRSLRQRHVAIQIAIIAAISGYLLHSLFDFPLRIAPLYSTLILLLAIWSAGDRLWNIKVPPLEDRPLNDEEAEKKLIELIRKEKNHRTPRSLIAVWSVTAIGVGFVFVLIGVKSMTWFVNPLLTLRANQMVSGYAVTQDGSPEQRLVFLSEARKAAKNASAIAPLAGETVNVLAQIDQFTAVEYTKLYQAAAQAGDVKQAQFYRGQVNLFVRQGITTLKRSLTEHYFFGSYRMLALMYYCNFLVDRSDNESISEAIEAMQLAIELNPGDFSSLTTLISWVESFAPNQRRILINLYQKLETFYPSIIEQDMIPFVYHLIGAGENEIALKRVQVLVESFPENIDYQKLQFFLTLVTGNLTVAQKINESIPAKENPSRRVHRGQISIKRGEYKNALNELLGISRSLPPDLMKLRYLTRMLVEAKLESLSREQVDELVNDSTESKQYPNLFSKCVVQMIDLHSELSKNDVITMAKYAELFFDDQETAYQIFLRASEIEGELSASDMIYFGRLISARYEKLIDDVKNEQAFAITKQLPKEEWPRIEDETARLELIAALELQGEAYQILERHQQRYSDRMIQYLRPKLIELKQVLAPEQ